MQWASRNTPVHPPSWSAMVRVLEDYMRERTTSVEKIGEMQEIIEEVDRYEKFYQYFSQVCGR